VEADLSFEGAVFLQFGPTVAAGGLHFVVACPGELDGIAITGTVDGAGEAIEGELLAGLAEEDVGAWASHVVIRRLNDASLALNAHADAANSLGSRMRL
jgi:hypothetical protein